MSKVSGLLKGGGENEEDPFQPRGVNYCPSFPKSVTLPSLSNGKKGFENLWSKRPKALKRGGGKGGRFSLSPCQREGGKEDQHFFNGRFRKEETPPICG